MSPDRKTSCFCPYYRAADSHAPDTAVTSLLYNPRSGVYTCPQCGRMSTSRSDMLDHVHHAHHREAAGGA